MLKLFRNISELVTMQKASEKNGRHPTEDDLSIIKNACILADQDKIVWVGESDKFTSNVLVDLQPTEIIEQDLKGATVLPCFVESHTHLIFSGDRSHEFEMREQGMTYQQIAEQGGGILSTVRDTRQASEDELYLLGVERIAEFARQGVSTVEIKSGYALNLDDELKMLRAAKRLQQLRTVLTYLGAHAIPEEVSAAEYIDFMCHTVIPQVAKEKLAERIDIFIEKGYYTLEQAKAYFECAKAHGLQITIHAEQMSRTGAAMTGIEWSAQSVDHLVEVDQHDIRSLANSNVVCNLLPAADYFLKMDYPPARELIDAGAICSLATDFNPGSSPTQDLSLVGLLAQREMQMTLPECLVAYTFNAAQALGKSAQIGSIAANKSCDLTVLKGDWRELFQSEGQDIVAQTWVKNKQVY